MKTHPLVALDLGATKVACAIGLPHEQMPGFELMGTGLAAYPTPLTAWLGDPVLVSRAIEQAVEAAAVAGTFDCALVAISHPALASERVRATIPLGDEPIGVRARDLHRLQTAAINQVLGVDREPLAVECLGCDGNGFESVRDPRGLSATRLAGTFHILTMPVAARQAAVQAVEAAGLEVAQLSSALPAWLASLADERLAHQRLVLIDVGGLQATIAVFVEGALAGVRVVDAGGVTLTHAIARQQGATLEQALAWSLEGMACRKPEVRALIEQHLSLAAVAVGELLKDQPRPEATLLAGRGALMDGFAEWAERTVGAPVAWCRSPRASHASDLPRQMGLSAAIGLLELATRTVKPTLTPSPQLFSRVLTRTKTLLAEYF